MPASLFAIPIRLHPRRSIIQSGGKDSKGRLFHNSFNGHLRHVHAVGLCPATEARIIVARNSKMATTPVTAIATAASSPSLQCRMELLTPWAGERWLARALAA
jgi:hypothetical protein